MTKAQKTQGLSVNDFEYAIFDVNSDHSDPDASRSDFTYFNQAVRWQKMYEERGEDTLIVARPITRPRRRS